jgi:hypothetical protein
MSQQKRQPQGGLEPRDCINTKCGKRFQPYRDSQFTCSRACYKELPSTRDRENAARRTPEQRDRKNEWRRTDPRQIERVRAYNRHQQLAKYGLTPEDYERMLLEQAGACKLCGALPRPGGIRAESKLHADHDHASGRHRDLLCANCNKGLGCFKDDPVLLRAAAAYIERHRAAPPALSSRFPVRIPA